MRFDILFVALLFVASAACVVVGVYMLVGMPWALIDVGISLFAAGFFLRSGLTPNA